MEDISPWQPNTFHSRVRLPAAERDTQNGLICHHRKKSVGCCFFFVLKWFCIARCFVALQAANCTEGEKNPNIIFNSHGKSLCNIQNTVLLMKYALIWHFPLGSIKFLSEKNLLGGNLHWDVKTSSEVFRASCYIGTKHDATGATETRGWLQGCTSPSGTVFHCS